MRVTRPGHLAAPDPDWYDGPAEPLSLFPQDRERARLLLHAPKRTDLREGTYPFRVVVRALSAGYEQANAGTLRVIEFASSRVGYLVAVVSLVTAACSESSGLIWTARIWCRRSRADSDQQTRHDANSCTDHLLSMTLWQIPIPVLRWDLQTTQGRDRAGIQLPAWLCFRAAAARRGPGPRSPRRSARSRPPPGRRPGHP